jgi:hypothetical protein
MPGTYDRFGDAVRSVIRAYHGSPFDFDKFDSSKIGTGMRNQQYGHGLYFIEDEKKADELREFLAAHYWLPEGKRGRVYEVEIPHSEEEFLDWQGNMDVDLDVNSRAYGVGWQTMHRTDDPDMRDSLSAYLEDPSYYNGGEFYTKLSDALGPPGASDALLEAGIPGLRYDDGLTGTGGKRNYVMFPGTEDRIRILRKYGLLPATLGAEGLLNQQSGEGSPAPAF